MVLSNDITLLQDLVLELLSRVTRLEGELTTVKFENSVLKTENNTLKAENAELRNRLINALAPIEQWIKSALLKFPISAF